jgi:hypothetical protein
MANFPGHMHAQAPRHYNDSILTITERSCADPYVMWDKGTYYMVSPAVEGGACLEGGREWADGFKDIHNRVLDRDMVGGQPVRV